MLRVTPLLSFSTCAILAASCASHRSAGIDEPKRYASILATNDAALHPRIVRLLYYVGADFKEPVAPDYPVSYGFVFDVLAPESERGSVLQRHYCGEPGGHHFVAKPGKTYLMTMDGPSHSMWAHAYTNEPTCCYAYRFRGLQ